MVTVRVNHQPFQYFEQINVSRDIDNICGDGQITVSEQTDDLSILKINDLIEIYLDGFQVLGGYLESVSDSESADAHDISFKVRDIVQDLIDSSVPQSVRIPYQFTEFTQIVNAILNGLNITNIGIDNQRGLLQLPDNPPGSGIPVIKAAEMGTDSGSYLNDCARIVSVIMNTSYNPDGSVNLLLRNFGVINKLETMLIYQPNGLNNNIFESTLNIDFSDRFGTVKIWSNGNQSLSSTEQDPFSGLGVYSGEATDNEVRLTRYLEIFAKTPLPDDEHCQMRAQEEINIRRARSFSYNCSVAGFSSHGQLWDIGQLVRVQDDKRRVRGWLLINKVEWEYTLNGGSITKLTLTYPDAYGVTLTTDASNQLDPNATSMGVTYNPVPTSQSWKNGSKTKSITSQTPR